MEASKQYTISYCARHSAAVLRLTEQHWRRALQLSQPCSLVDMELSMTETWNCHVGLLKLLSAFKLQG